MTRCLVRSTLHHCPRTTFGLQRSPSACVLLYKSSLEMGMRAGSRQMYGMYVTEA